MSLEFMGNISSVGGFGCSTQSWGRELSERLDGYWSGELVDEGELVLQIKHNISDGALRQVLGGEGGDAEH